MRGERTGPDLKAGPALIAMSHAIVSTRSHREIGDVQHTPHACTHSSTHASAMSHEVVDLVHDDDEQMDDIAEPASPPPRFAPAADRPPAAAASAAGRKRALSSNETDGEEKEDSPSKRLKALTRTCPICREQVGLLNANGTVYVLPCNDFICQCCLTELIKRAIEAPAAAAAASPQRSARLASCPLRRRAQPGENVHLTLPDLCRFVFLLSARSSARSARRCT